MNKLVIFDLDHTLLRINSSFHFGIYLLQQRVLPFRKMISLLSYYVLFKVGCIDLRQLHEKTFKQFFYGFSVATMEGHVRQFLQAKLTHFIYKPALHKLQEAQKAGFYIAILSSAPDFLVNSIAAQLGVKMWRATIYQKNGKNFFSQITHFMDGYQKAKTVLYMMNDLQICKENVTAYTDSYLDLPLLQMVGNPIAVNPDKRLKMLCQQNHWPII